MNDSFDKPVQKRQALRWSTKDRPSLFSSGLEYQFDKLPTTGKPKRPAWAGGYWPTYKDNLNHKWDGKTSDSPAKKYEKAFGGKDLEKKISETYGILSYKKKGKSCTKDKDCDPGKKCSTPEGESKGYCVDSWVGICHGWAPAAIMEAEPQRPVTHNGVTFKVNDIKALLSLFYTEIDYKFVSLRCNKNDQKGEIKYDEYGRATNGNKECRDTNPGTYHIILGNYLGIKKQSFVEDRIADIQVWNHPVVAFRVTQKKEVTAQEANELVATRFGGSVEKDKWQSINPIDVKENQKVEVSVTGSGDVDLHVRFGSMPTKKEYKCRPYKNGSIESCKLTVPSGETKMYVAVLGFEKYSSYDLVVKTSKTYPQTYLFNSQATKLLHLKLEVDYITESEATTNGNLSSRIKEFTRTDHYEYVLELDSKGKIQGGEWLGRSKREHPDFLWLPTSFSKKTLLKGSLSLAQIKMLAKKSIVPTSTTKTHSWNGNGSIISYSTKDLKGFGITHDVSQIHPTSPNAPAVFFQWEIDNKDGAKLKISALGMQKATITYGSWSTRSKDKVYKNVSLPFILDPSKDGFDTTDGSWFVLKVAFDKKPSKTTTVRAETTKESASSNQSQKAAQTSLDNSLSWNGNGSIISYSTKDLTGFGITQDVSRIHPTSLKEPAVFFQWEIDNKDGAKLKISVDNNTSKATITYGSWSNRGKDKTYRNVSLPFTIDPTRDGFKTGNGSWFVVKVAFDKKPVRTINVRAKISK